MSMTFSPKDDKDPTVSELVRGIVEDVHGLGVKELTLFCNEVGRDLWGAADAAGLIIIGIAVAQVGALLICFTLAQLLAILIPIVPLWLT